LLIVDMILRMLSFSIRRLLIMALADVWSSRSKHQTSVRRYINGAIDCMLGPPSASDFPNGEEDKQYQRFKAIDDDRICMVGEKMESGCILVNKESPMA
jgi:DNA-directed RNA polymerase beta subunit